jgi:phosphatidylglycerol---prolipoprotein diacylglyceryl transferase
MLPELIKISGIGSIYTFGLMITIGLIAAVIVTTWLGDKEGIPKKRIYDLVICLFPLALLGTRLMIIIISWREILHDWRRALALDLLHPVGFYLGSFLVALAVSAVLMRLWHLPWSRTADVFAPGLAIGNVAGRIGCFAAGCCWGKPTDSWMGVRFTERAHEMNGVPTEVALLPVQLIEAGANLFIFAFLLWLWRRRLFHGQIILAFIMLYAMERFVLEFWRDDPRGQVLELSTSQFLSVCMFLPALWFYGWRCNAAAAGRTASGFSGAELITQRISSRRRLCLPQINTYRRGS